MQAATSLQDAVLQYGLAGVVILALTVATLALARRYAALQEQRHEEMKLVAKSYHEASSENTRSLEELAHAFARSAQSLDELKRAVESLEERSHRRKTS